MASFEIKIEKEDKIKTVTAEGEVNILRVLRENDIYLPALCNGNGTCGKCKVRLSAQAAVTESDVKVFTKEELALGYRLACKAEVQEASYVRIPEGEEEMKVESEGNKKQRSDSTCKIEEDVFVAVDIGTTTIAMALVGYESKEILSIYTSLNHQRAFGADVINRIAAANQGRLTELNSLIREDLWKGLCDLLRLGEEETLSGRFKKMVIAGNTTMMHLLMGHSCESLGHHPFSSDHLGQWNGPLKECFKEEPLTSYGIEDTELMLFPGVSAFVGGDIVAGLQMCSSFDGEELSFLLDLGTNGEMVIGNKKKMFSTSAAAGPAFEGGNITCGTGSIPGAISQVKIQNRRAVVKTIEGSKKVRGICGTGIVSAIAELKLSKVMDKEGALQFPFSRQGFPLWNVAGEEKISLFQQDIRQFQMAKAAIRTGVEQLIEAFGCSYDEVKKVYLAGGFGTRLSVEDAIETGILPEEFKGKVEAIGNGALYGAIAYELEENKKDLDQFAKRIENIPLAQSEGFQEKYLKYMGF